MESSRKLPIPLINLSMSSSVKLRTVLLEEVCTHGQVGKLFNLPNVTELATIMK